MKEKFTDRIKTLLGETREWVRLEIEYAKLTAAEKFTILFSTIIVGAVCFLLGLAVLLMLAFALVEVFRMWMAPALAFVAGAGVICVFIILIYLLRRPLFINPISRFLTRLFFTNKNPDDK